MKIKLLAVLSLMVALFLGACGGASDADLQAAADKALKADTATSTVTVEVKDGVATVKGEVKDEAAKAKAAEHAKVEGVKSVTNEVEVEKAAPTVDDSAKTKVEEALKKAGFTDVTVDTTTTPKATLNGTVPKGKIAEAVRVAQEAAGKPFENKIEEK